MLTVLDYFKSKLLEDGLPQTLIDRIIPALLDDRDVYVAMRSIWNKPNNHYPEGYHNLVYANCKPFIFKWLTEHEPRAWFKVLFDPARLTELY